MPKIVIIVTAFLCLFSFRALGQVSEMFLSEDLEERAALDAGGEELGIEVELAVLVDLCGA